MGKIQDLREHITILYCHSLVPATVSPFLDTPWGHCFQGQQLVKIRIHVGDGEAAKRSGQGILNFPYVDITLKKGKAFQNAN